MAASGKSAGKGFGMPSPGAGKGGGGTVTPWNPDPAYNAANDVYGSGFNVGQPMPGYYRQYPAMGTHYAPPVQTQSTQQAFDPAALAQYVYGNTGQGYNPGGNYNPYASFNPYASYSPFGGNMGFAPNRFTPVTMGAHNFYQPYGQSSYGQPYNAYAQTENVAPYAQPMDLFSQLISALGGNTTAEQTATAADPSAGMPNFQGGFSARPSAGGTYATMGNPFKMTPVDESTQNLRNVMVDDGQGNVGRINVNWDSLTDAQRSSLTGIAQANPDPDERARVAYQYMQNQFGFA